MRDNYLDDKVFVDRLNASQLLYFRISKNKFMIYYDDGKRNKDGKYRSSGIKYILLTFGGSILMRSLFQFSGPEYRDIRILILVGVMLIVTFVTKDMIMELFSNRFKNDIYWTSLDVNKQEILYYYDKLRNTHKKITVIHLILFLLIILLGITYVINGELLILTFYMILTMFETLVLTLNSYKLYRIAKKQMIQLIESEENKKY